MLEPQIPSDNWNRIQIFTSIPVCVCVCVCVPPSESPYSEHGALEEVDNEGGTETQTSDDGESPHTL